MSAFNTQGSTVNNPQQGLNTNQNISSLYGGQGATVSIMGQPQPKPLTSGVINLGQGSATDQSMKLGSNSGILPSTPIKKITNPDGGTTEFHAPKVVAPDDPANKYNTTTGALNPNYKDPNATTGGTGGSTGTSAQNNNSGDTNNKVFTGATTALAGMGTQPGTAYTNAENQYATDKQNYENEVANIANRNRGINNSGKGMSWATGTENQLNIADSANLAGLSSALNSDVGALGASNTQQGLQQGALGTAAGLAKPELGQYGQNYYQPTMAGQNGGGTGQVQPSDPFYATLQSYAQQAANGQYSAIPSSITSNPVLNAQLNQMATSINPSYNPVSSAAQSGISTQQAQVVAGYKSALQQAQNVGSQLNDLINTFGLNPNDINAANTGLQKIAQNTSNPQYQQLNNYINSLANLYSQILTPTGGSTTDTTRSIASSMLDATAKGTSIQSTIKALDNEAQARIAGVPTSYGSTNNSTQNGTNGGSSISGFGWNG